MKKLFAIAFALILTGCMTAEPQPGRIEKIKLDDGREVWIFIPGYSTEDFRCEFETGRKCSSEEK